MHNLTDYPVLQSEKYIGLMSGTSLDGIDAVLVDLNTSEPLLLAKHFQPFDSVLKSLLLSLNSPSQNELHQSQIVANQLAQLYSNSVTQLLLQSSLKSEQVSAIGCHGQTVRHCPELGYTIQIGNAALLVELTGISVVSDFRSRDIAAGGQGAPLVPAFHDYVLRHPDTHRIIVNIGGISNLTDLAPEKPTIGFVCGPGNMLMDAWCLLHTGKYYDKDGLWASSGKVLPVLLKRMLDDPYFLLSPPKSSGRDLFNMQWIQSRLIGTESEVDVQATLLELTAMTIAQAINNHCGRAGEIYLCGGGARNQVLSKRLAALLPESCVQTTDALGLDGDYMEAIAFAWLAQQTIHGNTANLPLVTGAKHACILGAVYRNC